MKKIVAVLLVLLCICGCSNANSHAKYRIGVVQLVQHDALDKATQGFVDVLKQEYGDDIDIDVQIASGDSNTCSTIATNFVADGFDLIMANATPALQATANATNKIPVLGTSVTEYGVALDIDNFDGLVGTNISGTSDLAPLDRQAQMILDLFPDTKKVGLLYCNSEANSKYQVNEVEKYLNAKGIETYKYAFDDSNNVDAVAQSACEEIDVLYIPTDNTCASNGGIIANAANSKNIPIIAGEKDTLIKCEGVATLSIDYYELGQVTGNMAIRILNGEDITSMKIETCSNPTSMYIKEKADKFGIVVPSDYVEIKE